MLFICIINNIIIWNNYDITIKEIFYEFGRPQATPHIFYDTYLDELSVTSHKK